MSIFLSEKLYFIFSKYSFLNEKGFGNTLIGLELTLDVITEVEDRMYGSENVG